MEHKGKLELTWVGKYDDKVIEPRILMEDREKSYGDPRSENMLIHGDNQKQRRPFRRCEHLLRCDGPPGKTAGNQSFSLR